MPEPRGSLRAGAVRRRLPDGWCVEDDGDGVRGYTDPGSADRGSAAFYICPDGGLWTASWGEAGESNHDERADSEHVTGVKERCVRWVAHRARRVHGVGRE